MRHRIHHSNDLATRLDDYAARLQLAPPQVADAYQWLLANEVVFEEPGSDGVRVSICSVDIEQRLADAPGEVLDGDGQRKFGAWPAEIGGDGDLEDAETGPEGKVDQQDQRSADQDGCEETRRGHDGTRAAMCRGQR